MGIASETQFSVIPWLTMSTLTAHLRGGVNWPRDVGGGMTTKLSSISGVFYPLGYNASIDGLRAFSVMGVVLLHAGTAGFSWGGVGVTVFFVISGFLITSGLLSEHARTGRISIVEFYRRRALRLLPALTALCVFFLVLSSVVRPGMSHALKEVAVVALYAGNWVRAFNLGTLIYLAHTWSLAIEEQFYLVWPLFLIVLLKQTRNQVFAILAVIIGLILAVMVWRAFLFLHGASSDRLSNGTDTRIHALLVGAALAVASNVRRFQAPPTALGRWLWLPAIVFLIIRHSLMRDLSIYDSLATALAGAVLVAACGASGPFQRLFAAPPLVWIGQRSYGIYLWHYVILTFALSSFDLPIQVAGPISIVGGLLCAAASYRWVEQPFLRLRYRPSFRVAAYGT